MIKRTCLIPECANLSRARDWCQKHYDAWYRHGDPLHERVLAKEQICKAPGCDRNIHARKWCSKHYERWLKTGSVERTEILPVTKTKKNVSAERICGIDGCDKKHDARGLCGGHYRRWRLYGDPMADVPLCEIVKESRTCDIPGCGRKHRSKGLCNLHYQRQLQKNKPKTKAELMAKARPRTVEEKITSYIKKDGNCAVWMGQRDVQGYGRTMSNGKAVMAHRYIWEHHNGPIPEGLEIDHICHNASCVKVEHLRVVTRQQNAQHRQGAMPGNKSKIRGVTLHPSTGKWRARVSMNKKIHNLGLFDDPLEAGYIAALKRQELGFPLSAHDRQLINRTFKLAQ